MDFVTLLPRIIPWIILQTLAADHIGVVGVGPSNGALVDVPAVLAWHAAQHARVVDVVCGAAAVDQVAVALEQGCQGLANATCWAA